MATMEQEMMNEQAQEQVQATEREVEVVDRGVELPLTLILTKNKDGQVYHNYKIKLDVCGRQIQIDMRPKEGDRNAYELSDPVCREHDERRVGQEHEVHDVPSCGRGSGDRGRAERAASPAGR